MGTLGAGNHYAEIQVVEEIYDAPAARKMGIDMEGQVCVMLHKKAYSTSNSHVTCARAKCRCRSCDRWCSQISLPDAAFVTGVAA
jgi:hypothetical protein